MVNGGGEALKFSGVGRVVSFSLGCVVRLPFCFCVGFGGAVVLLRAVNFCCSRWILLLILGVGFDELFSSSLGGHDELASSCVGCTGLLASI